MSTPIPDPPPLPTSVELATLGLYSGGPGDIEGVDFWPRVAARIIDTILHYLVGVFTGLLFGIMLVIAAAGHPDPLVFAKLKHTGVVSFILVLLGSVAFHTILESVHGSTPGKLVFSMVVVQEDGTPCRAGAALIRSLAYFVDALFFGLIGYFAMQGSSQQQRHGDAWAHTVVCKRFRVQAQNLRGGGRFVLALLLAVMADSALIMISLLLKVSA